MNDIITATTPLVTMTAGQLADFLKEQAAASCAASTAPQHQPGKHYVYGLRGIMQLFNVSNMTAQRYKAGIIKDAVTQHGRKIIVDADMALELFKQANENV